MTCIVAARSTPDEKLCGDERTPDASASAQMESVYFPVTIREFGARLMFRDLREESLEFGPVRIDRTTPSLSCPDLRLVCVLHDGP